MYLVCIYTILLTLFVLLHQLRGLYVIDWLPDVITFRVALPLDKILQLFLPPMTSVAPDGLNFVLFLVINKVRWGPRVVLPVFSCLHIRG